MPENLFVKDVVGRFEGLNLNTVDHLIDIYSNDAVFKDPFNEVTGRTAIKKIFTHMFEQVDQPQFIVSKDISTPHEACLTWEFRFYFKNERKQQVIKGCSWLTISQDSLITEHRDYWDAAEELYEKLPLIGFIMRLLKKKLRAR